MDKHLYKSDDAVFAGVCGGFAEYFDLDPTLIRILFVVICFTGVGVPAVIYLVVMFIMPKKPPNGANYIDVKPSSSGKLTTPPCSASVTHETVGFTASTNSSASPGSAYTTANPQAFDVDVPKQNNTSGEHLGGGIQAGAVFGIILISLGVFAFFNIFLDIDIWRFWPMILVFLALFTLVTPSSRGWSLERAGNAIFLLAVAILLQFWILGFLELSAILRILLILWPVLLVSIGLGILGAVTKKSIFNLLSSIIVSAALLFGVWFYGQIPEYCLNIDIPFTEDRSMRLNTPASPSRSSLTE